MAVMGKKPLHAIVLLLRNGRYRPWAALGPYTFRFSRVFVGAVVGEPACEALQVSAGSKGVEPIRPLVLAWMTTPAKETHPLLFLVIGGIGSRQKGMIQPGSGPGTSSTLDYA